jgi:hypothetical protein
MKRKKLLRMAGLIVFASNVLRAQEPSKPMVPNANPRFEVATIKPSESGRPGKSIFLRGRHVLIGNYDVNDLILFAYGLHFKQIVSAPEWFGHTLCDIEGVADVEGQPSVKQEKGYGAKIAEPNASSWTFIARLGNFPCTKL